MASVDETVLVTMLKYWFELFQKRLLLFWLNAPPAPANNILPWVKAAKAASPLTTRSVMVVVAKVDVPAAVKLASVVEPVTVRSVIVVVARVDVPAAVKLASVVEPVTAKLPVTEAS